MPIDRTPKYSVGYKFLLYSEKHKKVREIVDIHTTRNLNGDYVMLEYVAEHEFLGQKVRSKHLEVAIARSQEVK